jgi:soluble lytic murein transglycosylase
MRAGALGLLCWGVLVGVEARAFQPYLEPPRQAHAEVVELRERLEVHGEALARLEQEAALYAEAERLGVVAAVESSGLPHGQQRRLAVAIVREAHLHKVDPLLVVAIIRCESAFNPYAVSHVGAMGLMQVMPATGSWLADRVGLPLGRRTNLFDLELNVELGTRYLAELLRDFKSVHHALVAYNAGPGMARRILAQREIRERFISGYPAKVVREWRRLQDERARREGRHSPPGSTVGGQS